MSATANSIVRNLRTLNPRRHISAEVKFQVKEFCVFVKKVDRNTVIDVRFYCKYKIIVDTKLYDNNFKAMN